MQHTLTAGSKGNIDPATSPLKLGAEVFFLLVSPVLIFFLFNVSPLNQAGSIDPYVYTGYIKNPQDLLLRFHLPYYSVRFGLILPERLFALLFGSETGYFLLRYLLVLIAGVPFYALVRRNIGLPVALVAYCALLTSPIFSRSLFWTHPDATAVPFLFCGCSLLALELRPSWASDTAAGLALGLSIHSNFFTISVVALFLMVFVAIGVAYRRPARALVRTYFWLAVGFVLTTIVGMAYYYHQIGKWEILSPSLAVSRWLTAGGMRQWRTPGVAWVRNNLQVLLLPFLVLLSLAAGAYRRRDHITVLFVANACAMCLYFYVYQFAFNANILELPYYYAYCIPAMFLLLPVMFACLWQRADTRSHSWLAALAILGFGVPWLLKAADVTLLSWVHMTEFLWVAFGLITLIGISSRAPLPGRVKLSVVALGTIFVGVVFDSAFGGLYYSSTFRSWKNHDDTEARIYDLAGQFVAAVPKVKETPGGVKFWYSNRPGNYANALQSTYLWGFSKINLSVPEDPGMPYIGAYQLSVFRDKDVRYLVLLGETDAEINDALRALKVNGALRTVVDQRTLVSGKLRMYMDTVELSHPDLAPVK